MHSEKNAKMRNSTANRSSKTRKKLLLRTFSIEMAGDSGEDKNESLEEIVRNWRRRWTFRRSNSSNSNCQKTISWKKQGGDGES